MSKGKEQGKKGQGVSCLLASPWWFGSWKGLHLNVSMEGAQLPVSLLRSTMPSTASGSPPCGSDCCWGLGYLLQPLPNH